jgi:hypothetical protein
VHFIREKNIPRKELELRKWSSGTGAWGLKLWDWSSGTGAHEGLELRDWSWTCGSDNGFYFRSSSSSCLQHFCAWEESVASTSGGVRFIVPLFRCLVLLHRHSLSCEITLIANTYSCSATQIVNHASSSNNNTLFKMEEQNPCHHFSANAQNTLSMNSHYVHRLSAHRA